MLKIENLEPQLVWKHFDAIRKIPRCSKHEDKIQEYIINFGKKQKLKTKIDNIGNVVLYKPATEGMHNKPIVVLQTHVDMVCEKNSNVKFDFSKDPIQLRIRGDILTAVGTSLGADNGIGVAINLAILENKQIRHGPIESLYTVDEELGFSGALAIKSDMLSGKIMINLDSEKFGIITIGCAGSLDSTIELPVVMQSVRGEVKNIVVKVSGLRGGHSGVEIHEQRGNAIKILARLLWKAALKYDFSLFEIKGGNKLNAIPREAFAKLAIEKKNKNAFITELRSVEKDIYEEIKTIDPNFKVDLTSYASSKIVLSKISQFKLINLLHGLPHGVYQMNYDIKNLVNTSTNLAMVSTKKNAIIIEMCSRSAMKSALWDMYNHIKAIASLADSKVSEGVFAPGWKPDLQSKILVLSKKIYKDMYKADPAIEAMHGTLECGVIGDKFPGMDMISIGPTLKNLHSPEEQVYISSVDKLYKYLIKILESI